MSKKQKRRRRPIKTTRYKSVCRDCGLEQKCGKNAFFHASAPRCVACGGLLERVTHVNLAKRNSQAQ
jgi:hypothetical protein